jgi:hypothetical protein
MIECTECSYALIAEVDQCGNVQMQSKVKINNGDPGASHTYLHIAQEEKDVYDLILEDITNDSEF